MTIKARPTTDPQRSDAYGGIKTIILIQHKKCLCFVIYINKMKGTKRNLV